MNIKKVTSFENIKKENLINLQCVKLVNYTSNPLIFLDKDGNVILKIDKSEQTIRLNEEIKEIGSISINIEETNSVELKEKTKEIGDCIKIPIIKKVFSGIKLPEKKENTLYVVPLVVAQYAKSQGRNDFLAPGKTIRVNNRSVIKGTTSLSKVEEENLNFDNVKEEKVKQQQKTPNTSEEKKLNYDNVTLVNLMPHPLTLLDKDGNVILKIDKSEQTIRLNEEIKEIGSISINIEETNSVELKEKTKEIGDCIKIPITKTVFGGAKLPEKKENTLYVVSLVVAKYAKSLGRNDFLTPGEVVRDGSIIRGIRSLAVL